MAILEVSGFDKVILDSQLLLEVMKHQNALTQPICAHLETASIAGERILANRPVPGFILHGAYELTSLGTSRQRFIMTFVVVKDHLKQPVAAQGEIFARLSRRAIAIVDPLEITICRAAGICSVFLVRFGYINPG